jgi:hypothetical protein
MVFCEHLQNCGGFVFAIYSCSSKRRTNSLWLQMDTCCLVGVDCPLTLCLVVVDDTKQGANLLGLLVQIVVARVNFLHEETRGLYQTLKEHSKKLSSFFVKQPTKKIPCLVSPTPPSGCQAQGVNVSKINMICNKINNNAIK